MGSDLGIDIGTDIDVDVDIQVHRDPLQGLWYIYHIGDAVGPTGKIHSVLKAASGTK